MSHWNQGWLLGDANDAFASGLPAREAPRGPPDQPTGQNFASSDEKWTKLCLLRQKMIKTMPSAVKNSRFLKNVAEEALPEKMHQGPRILEPPRLEHQLNSLKPYKCSLFPHHKCSQTTQYAAGIACSIGLCKKEQLIRVTNGSLERRVESVTNLVTVVYALLYLTLQRKTALSLRPDLTKQPTPKAPRRVIRFVSAVTDVWLDLEFRERVFLSSQKQEATADL